MRLHRLAVPAVALGLLLAGTANAAPTKVPQIKDPAGDAAGAQAGTDIVSVLFTTAGKGSGKGYVPKTFSVTMTLAGPALSGPGLTYEVHATTTTCGDIAFTYEPGTAYEKATGLSGWADWGSCDNQAGDGSIELLTVETAGNKVVWEFGYKAIGLKAGAVLSNMKAYVDPSNPAVPFPASENGGPFGVIDVATGAGSWTLS
jgi:hypothetical protein